MPTKASKQSNGLMKKKKNGAPSQLTKREKVVGHAVRAGLSLARGDYLGAGMHGAESVLNLLSSSDNVGLQSSTVSAPVSRGTILKGGTRGTDFSLKQLDSETIQIAGRCEIAKFVVGNVFSTYKVYDILGTYYVLDNFNPFYALTMTPQGAGTTAGFASKSGYGASLTPYALRVEAMKYSLWRYEKIRYTFLPTVPTSTAGSVSLAWTNTTAMTYMNASTTTQAFGPTPGSPMNLSQLSVFSQAPAWQSHSIEVAPRRHGICENKNDWLSTGLITAADATMNPLTLDRPATCGALAINMSDYNGSTEYTAGYLMMDYVVTFHQRIPIVSLTNIFQLSDFVNAPCNSDILSEICRRASKLRADAKGDKTVYAKLLAKVDDDDTVVGPTPVSSPYILPQKPPSVSSSSSSSSSVSVLTDTPKAWFSKS